MLRHACSCGRALLGQQNDLSNAVHPEMSPESKLPPMPLPMLQAFQGLAPKGLAALQNGQNDDSMQELQPEEERNDGFYEEVMSDGSPPTPHTRFSLPPVCACVAS